MMINSFLWWILAHTHPMAESRNGHPTRVSRHGQNFNKLSIQGFDFSNGHKGSDLHKFEKLNF